MQSCQTAGFLHPGQGCPLQCPVGQSGCRVPLSPEGGEGWGGEELPETLQWLSGAGTRLHLAFVLKAHGFHLSLPNSHRGQAISCLLLSLTMSRCPPSTPLTALPSNRSFPSSQGSPFSMTLCYRKESHGVPLPFVASCTPLHISHVLRQSTTGTRSPRSPIPQWCLT
jgi:hypothetical protein